MAERSLTDFLGVWRITRQIANAVGPDARFVGEARFDPGEGGMILTEQGEMRIGGEVPMQATRRYIWREGPGGLDVYFDDGRFFHHIGPGAAPQDRHDCAPDIYDVTYDFRDWPRWSSVWTVTGPRKNYAMQTAYERP